MFFNSVCPLREEFLFNILWYESVIHILLGTNHNV